MANGCVPLVSALDCFRDYIEENVTGFVFDHRRENAAQNLAQHLTEILSLDPGRLAEIRAAVRAKAAEFALEPVAQRYLDDFASLLASHAG
jgi:glycosyltransferase involved in cell wall biosynthesis